MGGFESLRQADWLRLVTATRRVAPTRQDAEDAVQSACLRAWQSGDFRGEAALTTYLYRAAQREALNAIVAGRAQKRGGGRRRVEMPELGNTSDPCLAVQYWRKCLELEKEIEHERA